MPALRHPPDPYSLKYISWKDRKAFLLDLRKVDGAPTREAAETALEAFGKKWGSRYAVAIRSWHNNWEDLATFFRFSTEIRHLIYVTFRAIYVRILTLRKVIKSKGTFPSGDAAKKLLFLACRDIVKKWTMPIFNWPPIQNRLVICFEQRLFL